MPSVSDGISTFNLHGRFNMKKLAVLTAFAGCKDNLIYKK
ncbi:hypothetical protein NEICINOT_04507 [Neisseria cinerea ATCC 14685]|uniref:Uncharacterized protein n=1 Tax=Neisseria cinerea ATCC 14685 TaxID=546262 RepID=D0W4B0_NEICI|nr:hypothetical protein NEICINOT_04507 [Neisseria cinerea ATCC 14685]